MNILPLTAVCVVILVYMFFCMDFGIERAKDIVMINFTFVTNHGHIFTDIMSLILLSLVTVPELSLFTSVQYEVIFLY